MKQAAKRNRKHRNLIRSALEFYEFLSEHLEKMQEIRNEKSKGKCNHFKQDGFFITNINRTKELKVLQSKEHNLSSASDQLARQQL